jgi:hypothetical protein
MGRRSVVGMLKLERSILPMPARRFRNRAGGTREPSSSNAGSNFVFANRLASVRL